MYHPGVTSILQKPKKYKIGFNCLIGVCLQSNGVAFSIVGFDKHDNKIELLKTWNSPIASKEKLLLNLREYLENYLFDDDEDVKFLQSLFELSDEDKKNAYMMEKKISIDDIGRKINTFFITNTKSLEKDLKFLEINNNQAHFSRKIIECKSNLQISPALMLCGLNDGLIAISQEIDLDLIKHEIESINLEKMIQSPLGIALHQSFGELMYLKGIGKMPYIHQISLSVL
ncbi:MAG: hypothetical protein KME28_27590 [Pelatocladus maniniholoensis HA4357-MV3]|jgi:hypothetical protein|uniref:Uncharacterized protein n=1 Tax=Pelatocladus maniniholoensis HA4357-MV3 TaxID=1117104 RepID=A0A9E3HDY9_9NOST|nr:hypothetical protein [Pelatocladus maniniholoensis HA4357-MV3]